MRGRRKRKGEEGENRKGMDGKGGLCPLTRIPGGALGSLPIQFTSVVNRAR